MAKSNENNISDEDYLESLLNSVVSNENEQKIDNNEQVNIEGDFDLISEDDLFDFGDISFDDLLEESLNSELDSLDLQEDAASLAPDNIEESTVEEVKDNDLTLDNILEEPEGTEIVLDNNTLEEPESMELASDDKELSLDESSLDELMSADFAQEESVSDSFDLESIIQESDTSEPTKEDGLEQDDMQSLFDIFNADLDSLEEQTEPDNEQLEASDDMDELSRMLSDLSGLADEEDQAQETSVEEIDKEESSGNKQGIFSKIFGKKKDKTQADSEPEDSQMISFDDLDLADIEDRTEEIEKEKAKAEKAESKAKKAQEKKEKREQAKAEREEKAKKKKAEKEKRVKPPAEVIDIPAPVYILIITFVAGIGLLVYFGSNALSYSSDMKSAIKAYTKDEYSDAYDYLSGMDIKSKDKNFYEQVITIMYVEKQYLSYNNYRKIEDYNRALDSLLKGIEKYDKHKATAQELNVLDDFKVSYNRIIKALKYDFKLSEEDAREIANILNERKYSERVREVVEDNLSTIENNINKENKQKATK